MENPRNSHRWTLTGLVCLGTLVLLTSLGRAQTNSARPRALSARGVAGLNGFVENRGQWPAEVLYFAQAGGIEATLLRDALVFRAAFDRETNEWPEPVILRLPGPGIVVGEGAGETKHHFLIGSTRASNALGFDRVVYHEVKPGVDLVMRIESVPGAPPRFAYDLEFAPNADPNDFTLTIAGATDFAVNEGSLSMQTSIGPLEHRIGAAWQVEPGSAERTPIAAKFRSLESKDGVQRIGFKAEGRDPLRAFVIDPTMVFGTYLGGPKQENFRKIAVDSAGAVYVLAQSFFQTPTTAGAFQTAALAGIPAWIGKLSPDGKQLVWATFLGGGLGTTDPIGIDVDHDGTVVVFGHTWASDFPATLGSYQSSFGETPPLNQLFATRLRADGSDLVWSTFYGGPGNELAKASALFPNGDVLFSAVPAGPLPGSTPGAFDTQYQQADVMLVRIAADGRTRLFQTYFHGGITQFAVDALNNIYFAGGVSSQFGPMPTTPFAFQPTMAPTDSQNGFVGKMDPTGSVLHWATYLGGDSNSDVVQGLAVDAASAVYVVGSTFSTDFPITPGAFQSTMSTGGGGVVTKLLPGGTGLVWSTRIGVCCAGFTDETGIAVDAGGLVFAAGLSTAPTFPITADALQPNYLGTPSKGDAHYTRFDAFGENLNYSSWYGGTSAESGPEVALTASNELLVALNTASTNIIVTPGSHDATYNGVLDLVVAEFAFTPPAWVTLGGGKQGEKDMPNLGGGGSLTPGSAGRISVRGAAKTRLGFLIVGLTAINAPVLGGTLVPTPDLLIPVMMSNVGSFDFTFGWPAVAAGTELYTQVWIQDPPALFGWSATNAMKLVSQ